MAHKPLVKDGSIPTVLNKGEAVLMVLSDDDAMDDGKVS